MTNMHSQKRNSKEYLPYLYWRNRDYKRYLTPETIFSFYLRNLESTIYKEYCTNVSSFLIVFLFFKENIRLSDPPTLRSFLFNYLPFQRKKDTLLSLEEVKIMKSLQTTLNRWSGKQIFLTENNFIFIIIQNKILLNFKQKYPVCYL